MNRLLVALLLLAAPAESATYWVRPSGSSVRSGTFTGSDSTAAKALSLAWFNLNAVGGDTCRFAVGSYATPINPARSGTDAARITYLGDPADRGAIVVPSITLDSTSATDSGDYITVKGLTVAGNYSGGNTGRYHARWDSLVSCVVRGSTTLNGGYTFIDDCSFGDGTTGDQFTFDYDGSPSATFYRNFANSKRNQITNSTLNLTITGNTTPALTIRAQDSLYIARSRFYLRIAPGGSSLHLFTIYGMMNSTIEDCLFNGQTLTAQDAYMPSLRDHYTNNVWARDTLIEEPAGAAACKIGLMTAGDTALPNEYNGSNTYSNLYVRVRGYIGYQAACNRETHQFGIYISNGQGGGSSFSEADSLTFYHNTWINLGSAIMGNSGGALQYAQKIRGNLFYGGARVTCNGQIGYGTTAPGAAGALDSNLVWVRGYPQDSTEAIDVGGCSSYRPAAASAWCATYNQDCASRWLDPLLADTLSWQTIDPVPPSGSIAYSTLWADGYVGAVPTFVDGVAPVVDLRGPVPYTDTALPAIGTVTVGWDSSDNVGVSSVDLYYSKATTPTNWVLIASGLGATGTLLWSYPSINESRINVRARAFDAAGNVGTDVVVLTKECTGSPCDDSDPDTYREPFEP